MTYVLQFLALWATKVFETWFAHKQSEAKGAADAERRGVREAEAQEALAKEIDTKPASKDPTDDAFHKKYWRD